MEMGSFMTMADIVPHIFSQPTKSRAVPSTPFHSRLVKAIFPVWYKRPRCFSPFTNKSTRSETDMAATAFTSSVIRSFVASKSFLSFFPTSFQSTSEISSFQIFKSWGMFFFAHFKLFFSIAGYLLPFGYV